MNRERLKNWAQIALNRSYWKSVLAALVLTFTAGTATTSGSSSSGDLSNVDFSNMSTEEVLIILGILLVVFAIGFVVWIVGMLLKVFLYNPLHIGCQAYFCDGLENSDPALGLLGKGFKQNYKNVTKTMFFRDLYLWLWSLLTWIPVLFFIGGVVVITMMDESALSAILMVGLFGIFFLGLIASMIPYLMKMYEYFLIPYILADNPDMDTKEVFALNKKMMTGYKWEAFVLNLSFIGWVMLSLLTCGLLAIFYVEPYRAYTMAAFYKVRNQQFQYLNAPADGYGESWNGQI